MPSMTWKGFLTFGLVSIPVQLAVAARRKTVSFDLLHKKDHSRVRQVLYCQAENEPLERSEIVKGYQYQKNKYVEIDAKDLERLKPPSAKAMEISEFVEAREIDPLYFDDSYYLFPDEGGEKPYTLLFTAMRETKFYALAKLTLHQREHTVVIRCGPKGLLLHTMFYGDELRQEQSFRAEPKLINTKELALAKSLIASLTGAFDPKQHVDTYRERVEQYIQARIKGKKVVMPPAAKMAPVIDIVEALQKSLRQKSGPAKKPPAPAGKRSTASVVATGKPRKMKKAS